ncbi:hypothetical protein [Thiolinea disciformis]|uniref:hypothetical protein n=1 Tax=Thiolinea disciformis TaxID=125614 RepID=UPI00035C77FE|nr:hypothetical protein [Thiolinea disciformis]
MQKICLGLTGLLLASTGFANPWLTERAPINPKPPAIPMWVVQKCNANAAKIIDQNERNRAAQCNLQPPEVWESSYAQWYDRCVVWLTEGIFGPNAPLPANSLDDYIQDRERQLNACYSSKIY